MGSSVFLTWLIYFYFYCICGWIFESTYVSLKKRKFVNRGFMHGPWLPLYGSGAVLILIITGPFTDKPWLVYIVGLIGATILEYITGEAMVRLFKVRYWDYSYLKLQFRGHICVTSSIAWGFLSLIMVYVIHEPVAAFLQRMPSDVLNIGAFVVTVCMTYDLSVAIRNAMDLRKLIEQAERIREELELRADEAKGRLESKRRLAEATAVFVKDALEDSIEKHKENIEDRLDSLGDRIEKRVDSLEERWDDLEDRLEEIHEKMACYAKQLLIHNPGSRFTTSIEESNLIRKLIRK